MKNFLQHFSVSDQTLASCNQTLSNDYLSGCVLIVSSDSRVTNRYRATNVSPSPAVVQYISATFFARIQEHPARESTGLIPLTELKETYKGEEGGLYPGGTNTPPADHLRAGVRLARTIVPFGYRRQVITARQDRPHFDRSVEHNDEIPDLSEDRR